MGNAKIPEFQRYVGRNSAVPGEAVRVETGID